MSRSPDSPGHEAKYKLDEELHFKARCRRAKLFGVWAAEQMGMAGAKVDDYARSMVRLYVDQPRTDVVVRTVLSDLQPLNLSLTEHDVVSAFDRYLAVALEQRAEEFPWALDFDHVRAAISGQ